MFSDISRLISSAMNVLSEKLKRRDFVAIGFESGLTFANKESSSTEAAAKAHDGELETIKSDCGP